MRTRMATIGIALLLCAVTLVLAQNGDDLFRQARAKEVVDGDIPAAIQIYERIVRDFSSNRPLMAQALFQLGECYERLNQQTKSREYFQRIVDQFKDQTDTFARATSRIGPIGDRTKRVEVKTPYSDDPTSFAISPDGRSLVYLATVDGKNQLWLHRFDTEKAVPVRGTDNGGFNCCGLTPFWSPDSRSIGFFADGKLKSVDLERGTVRTLADAPFPQGGTWNSAGDIVYSSTLFAPLYRVSARDGAERVEVQMNSTRVGRPHFLPDGRRFLFYARVGSQPILKIGSLDNPDVQTLSVGAASSAAFVSPDRLVYTSGLTLFAQRMDTATLQLTGTASRLADRVATFGTTLGLGAVSASAAGPIAYRASSVAERRLSWRRRNGQQAGVLGLPDNEDARGIRFAPNGGTIALTR